MGAVSLCSLDMCSLDVVGSAWMMLTIVAKCDDASRAREEKPTIVAKCDNESSTREEPPTTVAKCDDESSMHEQTSTIVAKCDDARKVVVGYWQDPQVLNRIGGWVRIATACAESRA